MKTEISTELFKRESYIILTECLVCLGYVFKVMISITVWLGNTIKIQLDR